MSKRITGRLPCPSCHHQFEATLYRSIWIESPDNRRLIFDDMINVVTCPRCRRESRVEMPFLATNVKRRIAVWYEPFHDPEIDKDITQYASHLGATSFYATAPRIPDWEAFKAKLVELERRAGAPPRVEMSPEMRQDLQGFVAQVAKTQEHARRTPANTRTAVTGRPGAPRLFRIWLFGSVSWAVLIFLAVMWLDPFDYEMMDDDEVVHMLSIMLVPPLLAAFGKRVWDRWVA